ncbi:MAG: HEAT repeat domain-containing protein [Phycisphaerae bacterium]
MPMGTARRCCCRALPGTWLLALALFALLAPIGRAGAQEDAASELEELLGLTEEAPEKEAAKEEVPAEEAAAEEAAEAEVPTTPAEEEAAATGYGAAGLPISVAGAELQNNWRWMVHYFKLARFDLAAEWGARVLAADPDGKMVLALAESPSTGYDLLVKMARVEEMSDVAARLLSLADDGARMKRTDSARIQANLMRLGEGPRPYYLAMKELKDSGPYVVPHALAILEDPGRKELVPFVIKALSELGRPVVLPLVAALDTPNRNLKQTIVGVLGRLGYPYALPALKAMIENPEAGDTLKAAASSAFVDIAGKNLLSVPAKTLYLDLAEKYYYGKIVTADARAPTCDLFDWVKGTGLLYRAAPSKAVNEILASRACSDALKSDPGALEAVALWVSALMQMEAELGDKTAREADPFLPDDMPSVDFFARAVGQQHLYRVLDRAIQDRNTAVVVRACQALEAVANEEFLALYGQADVGSPLVMALTYADQRARFAAAFALADIQPTKPFTGAGKVVPVLTEALNLEARKSILLIEPEADTRNRLQAALRETGWNVATATAGNDGLATARTMPRVDAVVVSSRTQNVSHADVVSLLRSDYTTAVTPIVVLSWPEDPVKASWLESNIAYVKAVEPSIKADALEEAIDELKKAAGSMVLDVDASRQTSLRAARILKEIAIGSRIYSARRARQSLLESLSAGRPDELVIAVLGALAEIADGEITQAMANVGINKERSQPVRVAAFESLARAARFVGNKLTADQIAAIQTLATDPDDALRDAAGEALGGLDLDAAEGAKLILQHGSN